MATVRFILKEPQIQVLKKDQKPTLIFMLLRYKNKRLKLSTGKKIFPYLWNEEKQEVRATTSFKQHDTYNAILKEQKATIERIFDKLILNGEYPTNERLKKEFEIEYKGHIKTSLSLTQYIDNYINNIEHGLFKTGKGNIYKKSTIKNYKGFKEQFNLFQSQNRRNLTYEDITIDFYNEFVKFFTDKNYSINTIGRHIKNLKSIMKSAFENGYHKNIEFTRSAFKAFTVETDSIYLNEKELLAMLKLNLSSTKNLEVSRDVFLIGCYTAQRFSDYSRISKENIITLPNGKNAISINQMKTGNKVIIPIRPELKFLLEKYNYILPKVFEQKLNKNIKLVGKLAGINEKVRIESIKGGLKISSSVYKYDLIKTHTARRSGCTNMYIAGIPTLDIMKVSGHKTEREFLKYIKMNEEETAQNLSNHSYFTKSKMNVI